MKFGSQRCNVVSWHRFTIDVIERVPFGFELYPKPVADDFTRLERQLGVQLPESFKNFLAMFGVGDLGEFFKLYGPTPSGDSASILKVVEDYRAGLAQYGPRFDNSEVALRIVPFSSTYGGDLIGWEANGETSEEHPIVGLPRDGNAIVALATSFPQFVGAVLDGSAMKALGYADALPCPPSFEPWCQLQRS